MTILNHTPFERLVTPPAEPPPWWRSRQEQIQADLEQKVSLGEVVELARSPGGRPVCAVFYGKAEPELMGTANFNSACGSGKRESFCRRAQRQRPVMVIYGGTHGHEVEGMMAGMSAIRLMETGADLAGQPQPALLEKLRRLRLIVIPLANPDGRVRVPYDGFHGLEVKEMTRVAQGTRRDGTSYGWAPSKAFHPMQGDVGSLGGYFDDNGINLAHDEFFDPMSETTRATLRLIRGEAPDALLNLHSHHHSPALLRACYVPMHVKQRIADLAAELYRRFDAAGIAHANELPPVEADGTGGKTPSFNQVSAYFHAGTDLPVTFEACHGMNERAAEFDYQGQLRVHHLLFETVADHLLNGRA